MSLILLWDVMDTIVRDPFMTAMPEFLGVGFETLLRDKHPTAWVEFETGALSEDQFAAKFFADGRGIDGRGLLQHMRAHYRYIEGIEPLLGELKARGVAMHVLSNYPCWYRVIEAELALSRYLPWSFVSCETGLRKPDPACFAHAARTLNVPPSDCVLIDDRRRNCAGAGSIGMDSVLFSGDVTALRAELARRGLL
jgi:HAD superfamily hydrolase (TIGR01509 family)